MGIENLDFGSGADNDGETPYTAWPKVQNNFQDLDGRTTVVEAALAAISETIDDRVAALLTAGTNVTLTYNDVANTLTIAAAGGGGASALDDLSDVVLTAPSNGQVLKYNGTSWVNGTDATGGGGGDASSITVTPAGNISATDVQAALEELDNEKASTSHTHTASQVTDFAEAVDDRVAVLLTAGSGISISYNDAGNALTITNTGGGAVTSVNGDTGVVVLTDVDIAFQQVGTGATSRTVEAKLLETGVSPTDFGGTGDGTTPDWGDFAQAVTQAQVQNAPVYIPNGKTFNITSNQPNGYVYGPGQIKYGSQVVDGLCLRIAPHRLSAYMNPGNYGDSEFLYSGFPTDGGHGNTVFGCGAFQGAVDANAESSVNVRNTIFGAGAVSAPLTSDRNDAFGQFALRWMRYGERNCAMGSLSMQWGGGKLDDDPAGKYYYHDLLYNSGTLPSNVSWDAFGLETLLPGTRAAINSWLSGAPWATTTADFAYNISQGRDSLVEIVVGERNTGIGYRSLGLLLEGSNNTGVGDNAMFSGVFVSNNTSVGRASAYSHVTGDGNCYFGRNAGYDHVDGADSVVIGHNALNGSSGLHTGSRNVLIGSYSGTKADGTVGNFTDKLRIQNTTTQLLVQGDFATGWVGVGVPEAGTAKGRLQVYTGDSGATASTSADELIVEANGDGGLTIATPASNAASIFFADTGSSLAGYVQYSHASDYLRFGTAASERARISVEGLKIGGTAARAGTAGTNAVHIFNGTAPVGTLTNGCSLYSTSGEMRVMDAAGNATLISPHDHETNDWIYDSVDTRTGRRLRIEMERMMKALNDHFGWGYVQESSSLHS